MVRFALLTLVPLVLAGCAADRASPDRAAGACFWPSQVTGFSDAGPQKAVLRAGSQQMWELTLQNGCPDVDWALSIGIRSRGGQQVCPGRPAELVVPEVSGRGGRTCLVTNIRPLSPEEVLLQQGRAPDQSKP